MASYDIGAKVVKPIEGVIVSVDQLKSGRWLFLVAPKEPDEHGDRRDAKPYWSADLTLAEGN